MECGLILFKYLQKNHRYFVFFYGTLKTQFPCFQTQIVVGLNIENMKELLTNSESHQKFSNTSNIQQSECEQKVFTYQETNFWLDIPDYPKDHANIELEQACLVPRMCTLHNSKASGRNRK